MRLALFASMLLATSSGVLANSDTIEVGQILGNNHGQVINGWADSGGGFFEPLGKTEKQCCYVLFKRDGKYIIAVTEAVARSERGGVQASRVLATRLEQAKTGEEDRLCGPLTLDPLQSFINPQTKIVRSIFFDGTAFQELSWLDTENRCDPQD